MPVFRKMKAEEWEASHFPVQANGITPYTHGPVYDYEGKPIEIDVWPIAQSLQVPPRLGQIIQFKYSEQTGVVIRTFTRVDGLWTHVEVWTERGVIKASKATIARIVGKVKGLSRIDQIRQRNVATVSRQHGWFARIYEGKKHRVARLFSDQVYGSRANALQAALAWLTEERSRPSGAQPAPGVDGPLDAQEV